MTDSGWAQGWAEAVTAALDAPGGDERVLTALSHVPAARDIQIVTGERRSVHAVAVGDRRFSATADGRLLVEHVVDETVRSSSYADPSDAGLAVSAALTAHVRHLGTTLVPEIETALEGLRRS